MATKIVCIGDSHTGSIQRPTYPEYVDELFGTTYDVVNKGIAGNTTSDMLARFAADVIAETPGICIILGGYNDVNTGVANATIQSNLRSMYDQCLGAAPPIGPVAINLFPFGGSGGWNSTKETNRQIMMDWINQQGITVIQTDPILTTYINPANGIENYARPRLKTIYNTGNATDDGIHLNLAGVRALTSLVTKQFGFNWPLREYGFTRASNRALQVAPSSIIVHNDTPTWRGGFLRLPFHDDRLLVAEDAVGGTVQDGFLRTAEGYLIVTKTTAGATMQAGYLRSPPVAPAQFGKLVVTTNTANMAYRDGNYKNPQHHLLVAGI